MLLFDEYFKLNYAGIMNAEHQALAEYLERRFDEQFHDLKGYIDEKIQDLKNDTVSIKGSLYRLIDHVDRKNDRQDEEIDNHQMRISTLESDFRVLTS